MAWTAGSLATPDIDVMAANTRPSAGGPSNAATRASPPIVSMARVSQTRMTPVRSYFSASTPPYTLSTSAGTNRAIEAAPTHAADPVAS